MLPNPSSSTGTQASTGTQGSTGLPPYVAHVSSAGTLPAKQNQRPEDNRMFNRGADPYGDDDSWGSRGGLYGGDSYGDDDSYSNYFGDDDYYRRRRLTTTPKPDSAPSSRHLAASTPTTATVAVSSTGGFQVVGPKRCASKCVIASGLTTCPWLNGSPVCSSLSHDDLLKLDASIAKSARVWRSQGPACADVMIP